MTTPRTKVKLLRRILQLEKLVDDYRCWEPGCTAMAVRVLVHSEACGGKHVQPFCAEHGEHEAGGGCRLVDFFWRPDEP